MSQDLEVAHGIGQTLVRSAIWHGERCNWMGPGTEIQTTPTLSALGIDLYDGTSGIGYFLAELNAATGEPEFRRTAVGALRQALTAAVGDTELAAGMYVGSTGVAVAAAHAGVRLGEEYLVEQAIRLIDRPAAPDLDTAGQPDLLHGLAGQILGLLILSEMLARTDLVVRATSVADRLLAMVVDAGGWYCWAPPKGASTSPLAGISHGAAGIGQALLELSHHTAETGYRRAADLTFAYERHLFDPARGNWPDLRRIPRRASRRTAPFMSAWCHGAPGIAMSRLRAYQLYRDEACREEAVEGVATTGRVLAHTLAARTGNYSLCHGLGGNAEVLLHAKEILGDEQPPRDTLVREVAEAGLEHHTHPGRPWPCGVREGSTPGLMCGLAGIGLFYLRLHDPSVPSILLLKPDAFARV